jgi:F-box/WD-40 domain protein MET30
MCCFSQLSHLSESLSQIIRVDPFSLFPEEVSLTVLGYLDAISLGKAAQVSRGWKVLADDDLLWRRMCGQHIERKCVRCGWGLPLLERRRLRMEERGERVGIREEERALREHEKRFHSGFKRRAEGVEEVEMEGKRRKVGAIEGDGSGEQMVRRCSVAQQSNAIGPVQSLTSTPTESTLSTTSALTVIKSAQTPVKETKRMPWKHVYCERLVVERNWRKGKPIVRSFKGHENGVMCLQAHHNLHKPSYPVLITGSYDKTVKVWNLDTGEVIRTMKGHTRVVRALQFDQVMLVTGSSDRTLRIWNWRTGECLRVLEGHEDGVICLNYDRNTLASGSADHTIKVSPISFVRRTRWADTFDDE